MRHAVIVGFLACVVAACGTAPHASEDGPSASRAAGAVPSTWIHAADTTPAVGEHAMVATVSPLATEAGVQILRRGGNAIDAAVATAFVITVVAPAMADLGGGGYMVAAVGDTQVSLDFRITAPAAASRDMYLDAQGNPTDRSRVGHLSAGVPGIVAGLWEAHGRFGSLPWAELVEPAIRIAENGFPVGADLAMWTRNNAALLSRFPASAALFLPEGHAPAVGDHWSNPDLARTLRRIAASGPAGFYEGETADLIVAEMRRGGGIVTHDDLAAYRARWREPVEFSYRGHRIVSMPPSSSGGIGLGLIANILDGFDMGALPWRSPEALHLQAEAMRRAYAARNARLGDPDFVAIPQDSLLGLPFAAELRSTISRERATPSSEIPSLAAPRGAHTAHISIGDAHRNAVALTMSVGSVFGSGVVVGGAGFVLSNLMDDFAAAPGQPNRYGLVQGEANAIAPGKRPLSSMTPTIVLDRDARPVLVTGAAGGPTITSTVFQIVSSVLDHRVNVAAAVAAPRIHHQHLPDSLTIERGGIAPEALYLLRARGHAIREIPWFAIAPSIEWREGRWWGGPDPRARGAAAGY